MSVKPLYCDIRDVGKTIASTKKLFIWKFSLDGKDYTIELYNSMLSGKKKIAQNGQVVYENNSYQGAFQFPFTIGRNSLSIVQHGDRYELRINNQSFEHIMNQRNTQDHFRSDFKGGDARQSPNQDRHGGGASRGSRRQQDQGGNDEEEELRRAIELSKQTAKKEEKERSKVPKKQSRPADDSDDDNFGFDKFATYNKPAGNMGGDDINDFDFNSVIADSKKEEQKDDFNFGFDDAQPKSSAAPAKQSNDAMPDLMDLLGGDMPQSQQPPAIANNNNNFFGGANQQQPVSDPFSQQPVNTQQQVQEKPKFVPNPIFQSQMMPGSQQQMMYQQQFQGGGGFQQPQQQQFFQTGVPQQQQQFGGGMQMGMQSNMMGQQQPGMMGGAHMGGMPQQQQMQGQSPFDAFGSGAPQQQAAPQQQESTPFDLF